MSIEAAIAWEVCASIHQEYAKGKDGLFTTRQADFIKHADDARMKAEWQGLTDDELMEILGYGKIECSPTRDFDFVDVIDVKLTRSLINAIEAKLKEKNT